MAAKFFRIVKEPDDWKSLNKCLEPIPFESIEFVLADIASRFEMLDPAWCKDYQGECDKAWWDNHCKGMKRLGLKVNNPFQNTSTNEVLHE